jgi:hypothetical protein
VQVPLFAISRQSCNSKSKTVKPDQRQSQRSIVLVSTLRCHPNKGKPTDCHLRLQPRDQYYNVFLSVQKHFLLVTNIWA